MPLVRSKEEGMKLSPTNGVANDHDAESMT
jgi:hypothetical protein